MDEKLDYSSEGPLHGTSSTWSLGQEAGSVSSLEKDPSKLYLQYKDFHLHLVQNKEDTTSRRPIPTTKSERCAYFRNFTMYTAKITIVCMSVGSFNGMIWSFVINGFLKFLPHLYVSVFLASYAPEEHLFLPKMVPLLFGSKFAFITASICEMLFCLNNSVMLLGHILYGLIERNPWNHCKFKTVVINDLNITCLELDEFRQKVTSTKYEFDELYFTAANGAKFQLAQKEHLRFYLTNELTLGLRVIFFTVLWCIIVLCRNQVFTRLYWKVFQVVQKVTLLIEGLAFAYLYAFLPNEFIPELPHRKTDEILHRADADLLSESMTVPPVLHVLTSRSSQDIEPSKDSFWIWLSNSFLWLLRGMLYNRMRRFCKIMAGAPLQMTSFQPHSWFYYWPLFFSQFYLGDPLLLIFFTAHLITDLLVLIITYACIVEVIIWEWKKLNEWHVNILATVICIMLYVFTTPHMMFYIYILNKAIATLVEVFALYYMYPCGRLEDDIRFHLGTSTSSLRQIVLRIMPVFYFIKIYYMINSLGALRKLNSSLELHEWIILLLPYIAGILFIIYKFKFKEKRAWQRLIVPVSDWGPRDHQHRQLRKEYNSRTYIGSQARRQLSRYMIERTGSKAFQLDLYYDQSDQSRRSTMPTTMFRMDNEKAEEQKD